MPSSTAQVKEVETPWRLVRARVHVSLPPQQLNNATAAATRQAYANLLLRHSAVLGGVVAAHSGPLALDGPPKIVDASPFAHVSGRTTLLVFAPALGSVLTGVVTHIGPDHVGLSVHATFHAVLSVDDVAARYQYEHDAETDERRWRFVPNAPEQSQSPHRDSSIFSQKSQLTNDLDITIDKHIRFAVISVKATRFGLFQMLASIDDRNSVTGPPLGVVNSIRSKAESLTVEGGTSSLWDDDNDDDVSADFDPIPKPRGKPKANGEDLLLQGSSAFGSAFGRRSNRSGTDENAERGNGITADAVNEDMNVDLADDHGVDFDINIGASGITVNRFKEENRAIRAKIEPSVDEGRRLKKKKRKSHGYASPSQSSLGGDTESITSIPTTRKKRKKSKHHSLESSVRSDVGDGGLNASSLANIDGVVENSDTTKERDGHGRLLKSSRHSEKPNPSTMLADAVQAVEIGLARNTLANRLSTNSDLSEGKGGFPQVQVSDVDADGNADGFASNRTLWNDVESRKQSPNPAHADEKQPHGGATGSVASSDADAASLRRRLKRKRISLHDAHDESEVGSQSLLKRRKKSKKLRSQRISLTPADFDRRRSVGGPSAQALGISRDSEDVLKRRKSE